MLSEAITNIAAMAKAAMTPKEFHPAAEPAHVYYLDGMRKEATPSPRGNIALSIKAITKLVLPCDSYEVWYSQQGIVAFLDSETRRDKVSMPLELSDQLTMVMTWAKGGGSFSQQDLILLLRTKFKHCLGLCDGLLGILRKLKFSTSGKTDSEVAHNKASIGRRIETEVSGVADLPEEIVLKVPIFARTFPNLEGRIEVCLELNAASERIILHPVVQSIDFAISQAEMEIGDLLMAELAEGSVLYGRP